jgi:hypothetical protein
MTSMMLLAAGLVLLGSCWWVRRWWLRGLVGPVALGFVAVGGYLCWYEHRPQPADVEEDWFRGITYRRLIRHEPRPLVIHVVTVRLDAGGIGFLVTPPEPSGTHPLRGQTTSAFLKQHHLQVAINGGFFFPWHSNGPFDYYPHVGDPVSVHGLAVSNGRAYSPPYPDHHTFFVTKGGQVGIGMECPDAVQAISGRDLLVREGKMALDAPTAELHRHVEPRTALALNREGNVLLLFVIDGRQPNYSEGVTLEELAEIIREQQGWTALHLDGGGSSTLVRAGADGEPVVVNSPIHGRHPPGRERPVANHLGIFAKHEGKN